MMPNKRLLGLVPEAKKYMMQKVIFSWMSLLAGIIMWFCVGEQIEAVKDGSGVLLSSLLLAGGCICFRYAFAKLISDSTQKAVASVKTKLRSDLYGKLTRLGSGYDAYFPTAEVVQLSGEGVEQLESYFGNYIPQFFYAMLAPLTLLIVFLPLSPLTGVVLFLCVPLIPVTIAKIQRFAKKMLDKYWDAYANLGDSFLENLQGLTTLKVYGADEKRHEMMNVESEHFRVVTMKVLTMQLNSVTIMDFVAFGGAAALMVVLAVLRAIFRYSEQTCGHYIAFKLLAVIRDRVFEALRRLAPARLEGRGRGDLIAVITGDIELLEVFYAHTIAPVCIAFIVSVMMTFVIGSFHPAAGLLAANSYALIGIALPILTSHMGREAGRKAGTGSEDLIMFFSRVSGVSGRSCSSGRERSGDGILRRRRPPSTRCRRESAATRARREPLLAPW